MAVPLSLSENQRSSWQPPRARSAAAAVALLLVVVAVGAARAKRLWRGIAPRAAAWDALAEQEGELLYVALGDSTAQGVGSRTPGTSYVGLLADDLSSRRDGRRVRVVNLSVTGARVADVVREQLPALQSHVSGGGPPHLVTLTVGANDAGRTSPAAFRASLEQLLDALPPGAFVADVPDFGGGPRLTAARVLSAVVREEVDARPALHLVRLEAATRGMSWRAYAADLFHPADAGYRLYARAFLDAGRPVAASAEGVLVRHTSAAGAPAAPGSGALKKAR